MSASKRSALADYLVYVVVRIVVCVIQAISFDGACRFARLLAWLAHRIDKRHRLVALENLRLSFPNQYTEAELDRLVRNVYGHFATMLIEMIQMPRRYHLHNYKRYTTMRDPARMLEVLGSGRPVLCLTGHFGNWELAGYSLGLFGFQSHAIARPLDNPYLDDFLRTFRERTGQKLLAKHGDFGQMQRLLRDGGILGTLGDQDAGKRGLFVDFFGRPASTHKAIALLALEHKVPIMVAGMPRLDGKFTLWCVDVIYPEEYANSDNPIRDITQRFTSGLETLVRAAPEQYLWLHRRWKHEPPARKQKEAA